MSGRIYGNFVSLDSTTAILGSNGTYSTTSPFSLLFYEKIVGTVISDQSGTLQIQQSWDEVNWDVVTTLNVSSNVGQGFVIDVVALFGRLVYTNGSTAQTKFRLYAGGKTL
jgi:hypothetical protein